ncbi:putative resolvase [Tupanvirus soda lake]|uniref:Resolvase n=2 Tax=Tupanvirus TaxID=2094720 RepID=A0AC62AD08_9VIRU|nr:putative resolvase [Tupanvirus soda lake]QKU35676.1 putative resolvase [Tupanvirus soda lake]
MSKYITGKKASEMLKVHQRTLHNWDRKGIIDTIRGPGGRRLYNVKKYLEEYEDDIDIDTEEDEQEDNEKMKIAYVRVSTHGQKDDMQRQIKYMKKHYPNHKIIQDIGSGINFNRKGLRKIIKWAIEGNVKELVVAYKDRLTRFGFELIEDLIKEYSGGTIKTKLS